MSRKRSITKVRLGDYISWSGFFVSIASIVPIYTQRQTTPAFWVLALAGLAIIAFGLAVRISTTLFEMIVQIVDVRVATITTCADHHVDDVYDLARSFFGDEVTEPAKIKEIRSKYKSGLQVALCRDRGQRMSVQGYYFLFPINKGCVDKIKDFTFDVSKLSKEDIATQPRFGYAMYVGAIAGTGLLVRRELLGAIKLSGALASQTKTGTAYARAATVRGRALLKKNGFDPVHSKADEVGCFYSRKVDF